MDRADTLDAIDQWKNSNRTGIKSFDRYVETLVEMWTGQPSYKMEVIRQLRQLSQPKAVAVVSALACWLPEVRDRRALLHYLTEDLTEELGDDFEMP